MWVCVDVRSRVCVESQAITGVFLYLSSMNFWDSLSEAGAHWLGSTNRAGSARDLLSLPLQHRSSSMPAFYVGSEHPNLGLLACSVWGALDLAKNTPRHQILITNEVLLSPEGTNRDRVGDCHRIMSLSRIGSSGEKVLGWVGKTWLDLLVSVAK